MPNKTRGRRPVEVETLPARKRTASRGRTSPAAALPRNGGSSGLSTPGLAPGAKREEGGGTATFPRLPVLAEGREPRRACGSPGPRRWPAGGRGVLTPARKGFSPSRILSLTQLSILSVWHLDGLLAGCSPGCLTAATVVTVAVGKYC